MARLGLSGRELRQQLQWRYNTDVAGGLPQRGGLKDYAPDGSWLQLRKLENFFGERRDILHEERVHTQESLAVGEWNPDACKVQLTKIAGKFWKIFGHTETGGKQWLFPEEALYLMDEGSLEVYCGGIPLSMQKAYSVLLGDNLPTHHYHVYAHLCRYGYILRRHTDRFHLTKYERKIGLDGQLNARRQKKRKLSVVDKEAKSSEHAAADSEQQHAEKLQKIEDRLKPCSHVVDMNDTENDVCRGWFCSEWTGANIELLPDCRLPRFVTVDSCDFSSHSVAKLDVSSVRQQLIELNIESSNASKWAELKGHSAALNMTNDPLLSSPVGILWTGDVKPLVRPSQATTAGNVFGLMKVIENVNYCNLDAKKTDFQIMYDVFLPDTNFRKSDPGQPAVCLCITRQDESLPAAGDIVELYQHCASGTSLMWAVVDSGDVTFYSFNPIELPSDPDIIQL